jgi:signal transduction histidine kinase
MVREAAGVLTAGLADSPSTEGRGTWSESSTESSFAEVLADVVRVERVSVDSNFFDDLGADSMVMARFCARARKRPDLPSVSIKDIYQHPTIASLAAALTDAAPVPVESPAPAPVEVAKRAGTRQVVLCGALQLLAFFVYISLAALVMAQGYDWISAGSDVLDIYLRSVISGCALFLFLFTVPILAKWILIGRWKPKQIRIWSLAYVRFWIVKTLVRRNPIVLFTGSPLFTLYLRALGAKVGRGVVIYSTHVPICTDLLTLGEGTIIRKDCFINGYRAHAGFIQVGAITIGKNAVISEATVIDIDTSMGDGTQLGHASSLHSGQAVPDGQRWHGTPGQQTSADFLERSFNTMASSLEQSRSELAASRSRIVAAGDQARRQIERDLHDGIQQRLVSLVLDLRNAEAAVPPELPELQAQLVRVGHALIGALDDLRELSRGIHPSILSEGGLGPALKALARRSAVPVELDMNIQTRLPEPIEVAAYYVVSEALANAAKHAHASMAHVEAQTHDGRLHLSIRDDGVGGATPKQGSGLIGLTDRVEALGGTILVDSEPGQGTRLEIDLPIELGDRPPPS